MNTKLEIIARIEPDGGTRKVVGRDAWALRNLVEAGSRGITSIERPAPRLAHYVYKLRRAGFIIETIDEAHGGPFAGTHARYVLHSDVSIVDEKGQPV